MRPSELVDVFVGTDSHHDFGHGNTLPLMALPWGTHHIAPSNAEPDRWFFQHRERAFCGLRLTHQPSPWMADWCFATLMPQAGERRCRRAERAVDLPTKRLEMRPHRFACTLPTQGIELRAAPSAHGLALDAGFRGSGPRRLIVDGAGSGAAEAHQVDVRLDPARGELVLTTRRLSGMHADFALHLVVRVEGGAVGGGVFDPAFEQDGQFEASGSEIGGWLELPPGSGPLRVRAAGSFVDADAARALLASELGERPLAAVSDAAADAWDALLGRIELPDASDDQRALVATMAYRTLLFPRRLDEPGPDGAPRHRCPDTGALRGGVRCADNGFWDTARTVYPWYSLLCPDHLPTLLQGWLEGARATGWLASWASPGHRACMTGSYADAVFADAVARDVAGFDPAEALHYLRRHAEEPVDDRTPYGREGLDAYLELGYVPVERIPKSVARTLDYAYGDWCIARVAAAAGDAGCAAACDARAGNWRHVLCPETGFFRGRHTDGSWLAPFDSIEWGGPYVEGSAWQFAWHVPHQARELIAARGGPERARGFLQRLLDEPPRYRVGSYPQVIHEMREMAAADFGQYAHSNQPSHWTLPYLAHCGDAAGWSQMVGRVCRELHLLRPDGLPGDEDNGELSAWWLCAALGLFPHCPGDGRWLAVEATVPGARIAVPGRPVVAMDQWEAGRLVPHAVVVGAV